MCARKLESDNVLNVSGNCRECARCVGGDSVVRRWMMVVIVRAVHMVRQLNSFAE